MIKIVYLNSSKPIKKSSINKKDKIELQKIRLSDGFIKKYQLNFDKIILHFGNWKQEFERMDDNTLSDQEIGLPKGSLAISIPETLIFEIRVQGNIVHIGPFIVFIAKKSSQHLSEKNLEDYKSRFNHYETINGLVLICSSEDIDIHKQTISGYYYNPSAEKANEKWLKGIFPYPDAVFKKIRIPSKQEVNLRKTLGNKVFNTNSFSKLDLWKACSSDEKVRKLLPVTEKYQTVADLEAMLDKFSTVYLKPIRGMKGIGIYLVKQDPNGFILINHQKDKYLLKTIKEVEKFLGNKIKKGYIIQQGIPTSYKNKHFDFRLYFQKTVKKKWICQGSIGRIAQEESIVTNLNHVAHLSTGEKAIKIIFKVSHTEAKLILDDTINSCIDLCNLLDKKLGHFGDVAIDVIIDHNHIPWVLEVNNMYGKRSLYIMKDNELIQTLHTTPLKYAKALAGF